MNLRSREAITGFIEQRTTNGIVIGCLPRWNFSAASIASEGLKRKTNSELNAYMLIPRQSKMKISYRKISVNESYGNGSPFQMYSKYNDVPTSLTNTFGCEIAYDHFYSPIKLLFTDAPVAYAFDAIKAGIYWERDWWGHLKYSWKRTVFARHHITRLEMNLLYAPKVNYTNASSNSTERNKIGFDIGYVIIPLKHPVKKPYQIPVSFSARFSLGQRPGQNFEMISFNTYYYKLQLFLTFTSKASRIYEEK